MILKSHLPLAQDETHSPTGLLLVSHPCEHIADKNKLRQGGFTSALGFKGFSPQFHGPMLLGKASWQREYVMEDLPYLPVGRKPKEKKQLETHYNIPRPALNDLLSPAKPDLPPRVPTAFQK